MTFRKLCAAAVAAVTVGAFAPTALSAPTPTPSPAADSKQLGLQLGHEIFQIIDFRKLIADGATASLKNEDFFADVRPEWPQLLLQAMNEEVEQDGPAMEKMFGAIMAKNFSAGELQAGLTILNDPQFRAILIAQVHNQPMPQGSAATPCAQACMRAMQSSEGRAFMTKFSKIGDVLDKRTQREFAAILLPGVFRRFGEKAEAAEQARGR